MATTIEDIRYEEMLSELHHAEVMKNAALQQCIYIFVEGDSEEATFQTLLEDQACNLNFQEQGVVVANYNGIGNLKHAIRLLRRTLSHDRPIIVTYDDDVAGKTIVRHINGTLITPFKIPYVPVVTYNDGSAGGSFEEAFSEQCFLDACFKKGVLREPFFGTLHDFSANFDKSKPWFSQLALYVEANGGEAASINKVQLAEHMASSSDSVPITFVELAKTILNLRAANPVKHPDNVKLPI